MGEFCISDETGAADRFRIADGASRVGVNGAPDGSGALAVAGSLFVKSTSRFANDVCVEASVDPVEGQVVIAASSEETITHNLGDVVVVAFEISGDAASLSSQGVNSFNLKNEDGGSSITVDYSYW